MSAAALLDDLQRFDGRNVSVLEDIRATHSPTTELLDLLVVLAGDDDPVVQTGVTWLIRAWLQDGHELTGEQIGRLASELPGLHDGFGRLHLCQAMDELHVPPEHAAAFADFFRSCRTSRNTYLRAWAPHAFFRLALDHEAWRAEAGAWVEAALSDPAASVRARARRTLRDA